MQLGRRARLAPVVMLLLVCGLAVLAGCDSGQPSGSQGSQTTPGASTAGTGGPAPDSTGVGGAGGGPAGAATSAPSSAGLDDDQTAALYARVVSVLVSREVTSTEVIISPYIGQGEHLDSPDEDTPIPDQLLPTLKQNDPSHNYRALDLSQVIGPLEEGGKVKDGATFVTLGPVTNDPDPDTFHVRASIYWSVGHGSGSTYTLRRDASLSSGWKLITVEQEWSDN